VVRAFEAGDGGVGVAVEPMDAADALERRDEILRGVGVVRAQRERAFQHGQGILRSTGDEEDGAVVVANVRGCGFDLGRPREQRRRLVVPLRHRQEDAEVMQHARRIGVRTGKRLEERDSVGKLT